MGIIDKTSSHKQGHKTARVQRQYCGSRGIQDNRVVSVHLGHPAGDFHNAVERGNRRHRKRQTSAYRGRTRESSVQRIALDMQRDAQAPPREQATAILHPAIAG